MSLHYHYCKYIAIAHKLKLINDRQYLSDNYKLQVVKEAISYSCEFYYNTKLCCIRNCNKVNVNGHKQGIINVH